jgi:hypothetical protein
VLPLGGIRQDEVPMITIDISEDIKLPPFYVLARWSGPEDLRDAEREEAAAAGVTAHNAFSMGLAYNSRRDAEKVARCLAHRFGVPIGIVGCFLA